MIRRELLAGASAMLALMAISGCAWIILRRYRFRMTVVIDTPKGERSGSGVMEVSVRRIHTLTIESHSLQIRLHGEAVAVDIPGAPTLFALTGNPDDLAQAATRLFDPSMVPGVDSVLPTISKLDRADQLGRQIVMPKNDYPQFVCFKDLRVPSSAEQVDPSDLAEHYRPGLALNRITLTLTNEPVTEDKRKRVLWWDQHVEFHLDGSDASFADYSDGLIAGHLASGSFSTESFK